MAYTITLVGCKGDEIELIAMVMELCGLGMNEASNIVDHMPSVLFDNINEDSANKYKKLLEGAGAILKIDETAAGSATSVDPFAFPEPDFGKMMGNTVAHQPQVSPVVERAVEPVQQSAPINVSEPVQVQEKKVEEYVEEKVSHNHEEITEEPKNESSSKKSVVEITPRSSDSVSQEETRVNNVQHEKEREEEPEKETEEPKYEYSGYCPKCGSAFVTVKKVGGLFGSNKVKCVCEACKHKF